MWGFIPVEINSSMHRVQIRESALSHFQTNISDAAMSAQGPIYKVFYTDLSVGKEEGRAIKNRGHCYLRCKKIRIGGAGRF